MSPQKSGAKKAAIRQNAQARIAEQRAAEQRQRRQRQVAVTAIAVVIAVVAALIVVKVASGPKKNKPVAAGPTGTVLSQVVSEATNVPASALETVGTGTLAAAPSPVTGKPALTSGGKPELLYMGYEWCPYCAAERWPLVVALSRFGTFTGLGLTQSASNDVYPSTHTFTFAKATFTSKYLDFVPVEMQDANKNALQTPTADQQSILSTYDVPPYSQSSGGIPFVDLGNRWIISGASYSPQVLAGKDWTAIASQMGNPTSDISKGVLGTANVLSAAICKLTNDQPSTVCTSPAVTAAAGKLG